MHEDEGKQRRRRNNNETLPSEKMKNGGKEEEPTPRSNKNIKSSLIGTMPPPPPPPPSVSSKLTPTKSNHAISNSNSNSSTATTPKSPPPYKSLISPSTWFKSITSPGNRTISTASNNNTNNNTAAATAATASGKPPRGAKPTTTTTAIPAITTPSSPTSFSTFNLTTPPPHPFPTNSNTNNNNNNNNNEDSPPPIMDASTASSLLWEDMTLTSVSEEDAAAFRMFGAKASNQRAAAASVGGVAAASAVGVGKSSGGGFGGGGRAHHGVVGAAGGGGNIMGGVMMGSSKEGRTSSRARRLFHRWNDWDGFDNVVLSVTIFATTNADGENVHVSSSSSGQVIVMELLSTKNPPLPLSNQHHPSRDAGAAAGHHYHHHATSKTKQQQQQQHHGDSSSSSATQIKISSSSSNSSALTSPSSLAPPPPPPLPSLGGGAGARTIAEAAQSKGGGGGGGSSATSTGTTTEEGDDSTNSTGMNSKQTKFTLTNKYTTDNDEDDGENEGGPNHTRILTRRVLWWPSYIVSKRRCGVSKSGVGDDDGGGCPSFVSLGRTSVWKDRKLNDDNDDLAASQTHGDNGLHGHGQQLDDDDDDDEHDIEDEDEGGGNEKHNHHNRGSRSHNSHKQSKSLQSSSSSPDGDREERAADAMDAFRSLNFLFGGGDAPPAAPSKTKKEAAKKVKGGDAMMDVTDSNNLNGRKKLTQPLSMCFVTNDGHVHFFHALRVLLNGNTSSKKTASSSNNNNATPLGLSNSFAAFLLGEELYNKVNEGILPLSQPRATMKLSQLANSVKVARNDSHVVGDDHHHAAGGSNSDPLVWKRFLRKSSNADNPDLPTPLLDDDHEQNANNWASLGMFDASIDPSTLPLRTLRRSNVLTGSCITSDSSNGYLAICGKGLRRRIIRNEDINDNSNHRGRRIRQSHVLGGFVTFISLRHCAESRTVYLPFAPESIQPVYWSGMHFVVLLGEEGLPHHSIPPTTTTTTSTSSKDKSTTSLGNWGGAKKAIRTKCRRPFVMAVRVDCKRWEERNDIPFPSSDFPTDHHLDLSFHPKKVEPEQHLDSVFMSTRSLAPTAPDQEDFAATSKHPLAAMDEVPNISYPARFQSVSINLPSVHESLGLLSQLFTGERDGQILDPTIHSKAISISSIPSSPPGIILSFQCRSTLVMVNHTLHPFQGGQDVLAPAGIGKPMMLSTFVRPGHRVLLDAGLGERATASAVAPQKGYRTFRNVWCTGGQGWSLMGIQDGQKSYFICWDGATDDSQGPFILPLQHELSTEGGPPTKNRPFSLASGVMPLMSYVKYAEKLIDNTHRTAFKSPSSSKTYSLPSFLHQDELDGGFPTGYSPKRSISITLKESIKMAADIEGGLDDIIVNALDSISTPHHQSPESRAKSMMGGRANRTKCLMMSHQEKSKRLLRQCSSWTQLDDTKANHCSGQVIVATIRLGTQFQSLTLRTNIIANPISTPFNQVLSWLCQRRDYYTAASVALSLLDDADAVYELCGIPKSSEEEFSHHKGLLDGIKPLGSDQSSHGNISDTMTSLADMAVACLIKGGVSMSKTLEGFLVRNTLYSAPRACLMLVGATASVVSKDGTPQHKFNKNDNIVDMLSTVESPSEDLIWPVRCLVKMAVVRNCLPSTILMLNATIPNELRWRAPKSRGLAAAPRPSLGLFLALVDIILESTDEATRYFLNMMDEETGLPYWNSIDDDTKLALSLVSIRGRHVLLLEPEVRAWALCRLKQEIESPTDSAYNVEGPFLPDGWLKEVVTGAFCNAGCDIGLGFDAMLITNSTSKSEPSNNIEVACYRQDMLRVRDLLVPQQDSGGLDFDLLIAALLILACRGHGWREQFSTQTLLDTVCDMAGRKTIGEPKFVFDGATVMRQCALAENLQAAAFLIGGKKGLVLECADLVVSNLALTVKDAEIALLLGSLAELKGTVAPVYEGKPLQEETIFEPNVSHQHLMWLLDKHVLTVQTYGEFDSSSHTTGGVNPVFAGRVCFRAWYCLTHPLILSSSAKWLEGWLRRKLELSSGKSPRRLACAALVRTLLWADETEGLDLNDGDEEHLLAAVVEFDGRFMAELAQACCGLIQSIPPHLAEELMSSFGSSNMYPFESSLINSVQ
ncbi:hypothetical protein ACHAXR_013438 [Thalassiosira sp. AJA248-18]